LPDFNLIEASSTIQEKNIGSALARLTAIIISLSKGVINFSLWTGMFLLEHSASRSMMKGLEFTIQC
jgi:hypothetical protein